MKINLRYAAQAKRAVNMPGESLDVSAGCTLGALLAILAQRHEALRPIILRGDAAHPSVLLFVNDEQSPPSRELRDNDTVMLMPPIAGG